MSTSEYLELQDVLKIDILLPYELEWNIKPQNFRLRGHFVLLNKKGNIQPLLSAVRHLPYAGDTEM